MTAPSASQLIAAYSPLSETTASALLVESHGVSVERIDRLATERDDSFRIDTAHGAVVVAKFAHPLDDSRALHDQVAVLDTLAREHAEFPVQRVLPALDGTLISRVTDDAGQHRWVRVLSYLEGELLGASARSLSDMRALGAFHARFAAAIADIGDSFDQSLSGAETPWNLRRFHDYASLLDDLAPDKDLHLEVTRVLERIRRHALPRLLDLPCVLAHNDLHGDNVLVSSDPFAVTGVLDFGDMTRTPRVADLAVATSYARGRVPTAGEPWAAAHAYVSGYESERRLSDLERALLPELVLLRLAQRAIVNSAIASANPTASPYASRNLRAIGRDLRELGASIPTTIGDTP